MEATMTEATRYDVLTAAGEWTMTTTLQGLMTFGVVRYKEALTRIERETAEGGECLLHTQSKLSWIVRKVGG